MTVAGAALVTTGAQAQSILSYNVSNARLSGFGAWSHTYSGTITPLGGGLANYTGGSGTLNDGSVSNTASNNMLFLAGDNSVITLFLSGTFQLSSLTLFGGVNAANVIPGTLTGATIGFGGGSVALTSAPSNPGCLSGNCDDTFSFGGSALAGLNGNTITLSNFQGNFFADHYSISEIGLSGIPVSTVPEPASFVLMLAGLGALGVVARRRTRQPTFLLR